MAGEDNKNPYKLNEASLGIYMVKKNQEVKTRPLTKEEDIQNSVSDARSDRPLLNGINKAFETEEPGKIRISGTGKHEDDPYNKIVHLNGTRESNALGGINVEITEIVFVDKKFNLNKPLSVDIEGGYKLSSDSIKQINDLITNKEVYTGVSIGGFQIPFTGDLIKMEKADNRRGASLSEPNEKSSVKTAMAQASEVDLPNIAKMSDNDKPLANIPNNAASKGMGIA